MERWNWWACAGLVAGLLCPGEKELLVALLGLAGLGLARPALARQALSVSLFLGLGFWRAGFIAPDRLTGCDGLEVEVCGVVLEAPRRHGKGVAFHFLAEHFEGRPRLPASRLFVECDQPLDLWPGDRWVLAGKLAAPTPAAYPGGFDQAEWLAREGVHHKLCLGRFRGFADRLGPARPTSLAGLAWVARAHMFTRLTRRLKGRQLALAAGIVFGETRGLDAELLEQFRCTGTTHLLAASGLNVAIVAGLILWLGRPLGLASWRMAPAAMLGACFYTLLAGASPSVVRAAVMACLGLLAATVGRRSDLAGSLSLSILGCLLYKPGYLFDLGFQMSVLAVLGLMLFAPGLERRLGRLPAWLAKPTAMTVAATLAVLPVAWWNFHRLAVTGLLANLLMGPVAELILPLGLVASLLGHPWLFLLLKPPLDYLLWVVGKLALISPELILPRPNPLGLLALLALGVALHLWLEGRKARCWLALALVLGGLVRMPSGPDNFVRVVDLGAQVVWRAENGHHTLYLEKPWVEGRARQMLLDHGVSRPERVVLLAHKLKTPLPEPVEYRSGRGWRNWLR
ncbi:MAG: ComEC family competence protein [Candidatus Eremiobacteraeota bacterium]|nr:ComEC family competence protein [Candidatus Eremiobacteraeota bacterium]